MIEDKSNNNIELSSKEYLEYLRTLKEALNISEDRYKFLTKKFHTFMDNVKTSVVNKNNIMDEIRQENINNEAQNTTLKNEIEKYKIKVLNLEKIIIQKDIEIDELKIDKKSTNLKGEKQSISKLINKTQNSKGDDFIYLGKK